MKVVVASNAFKGSLSSMQVAEAVERAMLGVNNSCEVEKIIVSDGGDGFLDALSLQCGCKKVAKKILNPAIKPIMAEFGYNRKRRLAVIESARACGMGLISPSEMLPMELTSYGLGQLIIAALQKGANHLLIGLGGTATVDGGIGLLAALGFDFYDIYGDNVEPVGGNISRVVSIADNRVSPYLKQAKITLVCDVKNVMWGDLGAANVFAAQKGATAEQVLQLDMGLEHFANVIERYANHPNLNSITGGGAAGGIAASMVAMLGARVVPGAKYVSRLIALERRIARADMVITGEGRVDIQTSYGKLPALVAQMANKAGKELITICGNADNLDIINKNGCPLGTVLAVSAYPLSLEILMRPEVASKNITQTLIDYMNYRQLNSNCENTRG